MTRIMFLALPLAALAGCSKDAAQTPPGKDKNFGERPAIPAPPEVSAADQKKAAAGDLAFAADLHKKVGAGAGNLVYSPASISMALAMSYAGAAGKTAEEMKSALHFTLDADKLHAVNHTRLYTWNGGDGADRPYELDVADSLWGQKGESWKQEFLDTLKDRYATGFREVDFAGAGEDARGQINQWVGRWTRGKITEIIPTGILTANTRLVLANAVYFKGNWASQFDKASTHDLPFHISAGQSPKVPMMYQTGSFRYGEQADLQLLEMPYAGKQLSMVILLPTKRDGLAAFESSLSPAKLAQLLGAMHTEEVHVYVPRFKFESSLSLAPQLAALGMPSAFGAENADFSEMNGKRDLFITHVLHKATIEVNEEGSEASAATAVVGDVKSAPGAVHVVPTFKADHPFLFLIRDNRTGEVLFMGRVVDPSK